jgi:Uma2 family endonuclease
MASVTHPRATIDDLYKVEGKAELIGGRIVELMSSGMRPNEVAANIYSALREFVRSTKRGKAFTEGLCYTVAELPSGRESFNPDASYYIGLPPQNSMCFVEGPPTFAVEVRSENDYTPSAVRDMADKRSDYFQAGTQVVWDVDPIAETVAVYRATDPLNPTIYRRGDMAEANPAVPGWTMLVDDVFAA